MSDFREPLPDEDEQIAQWAHLTLEMPIEEARAEVVELNAALAECRALGLIGDNEPPLVLPSSVGWTAPYRGPQQPGLFEVNRG